MSRTLLTVVSIAILGAFLFVLAGATIFKEPLSPEEDVAGFLEELESTLSPPVDWKRSLELQGRIEHAWSRVERRLQLSVEKTDMVEFTEELVRLKAAIEKEEEPLAWEALALLKTVWNRMR